MRANWLTFGGTTPKSKVFVGLSGGVDSAVSAALLQKEGYDVVGAFIRIKLEGYPCSAEVDKLDAQRVAAHLGIPFVEVDLSAEYRKRVFALSMREFEAGRTPNPDALCNREIKFGVFYDWCMAQGTDFIATGHYARTKASSIVRGGLASDGEANFSTFHQKSAYPETVLLAGVDQNKDQSYFLWAVPQDKLANTLFPIGHLAKPKVRRIAARLRLPNFDRPDSQGLCFLGDVTIGDMLERELTLVPGEVLDEAGNVLGQHEGAQAYTLGQRHSFTLVGQGPDAKPHYVIAKDPEFNTITVSTNKFPTGAGATEVVLSDINWIGTPPQGKLLARYRYRQSLIPATLDIATNTVVLHEPHYVPLGQSLVLYSDERCIGGGIIESATLTWQSSSTKQTARRSPSTSASL